MSGGKVTVRQKMINMMYLVLTALLALNVSAEILKSFHMVEISMDRAGENIDKKNVNTLAAIARYHKDIPTDPTGTTAFNKSIEAKKISEEGVKYFAELKDQLIVSAGGRKDGNPEEEVAQASNIELHANLMINKGKGAEVKAKINKIKADLLALMPADKKDIIKSDLHTDNPKNSSQTWESEMFEQTPLAAVVALISKIQNDIKNTESQVLDYLRGSLTENVMIIDQLTPQIIPVNGTNITLGNKYQAEIFLAASSSRSEANISVNGNQLKNESGVGKYEVTASREGENKFKAVITTTNSSGKKETYEKEGSFFALAPLAVISATKMNVVYIGLDNPISVSVPGFAANKVDVRCEGGKLAKVGSGGEYMLTVDGSVREITISAGVDGKTMGFAKYRVRQIPKPMPQLGSIEQSGSVSMGQLKSSNFVLTVLKDFAFEGVKFTPISWNLVYAPKNGGARVESGNGETLSAGAKSVLMNARPGDRIILMNIKAKGPAGAVPIPASLVLEVRQ